MSKVIRVSLAMDFYPDEDLIADGMSEEEMIDYFKETFLDDIAEGIMRNTITNDSVDMEIINDN
jgi:hypothetical protein